MSVPWTLGQQNRAVFVMVDATNAELTGLTLTVEISKDGGAFAAAGGSAAEIGDGWYSYLSTVAEADTVGPVALKITAAGAVQQNLEYVVEARQSGATERTYTVTDSISGLPVQGVEVTISIDSGKTKIMWVGVTRADGVAVDSDGDLPLLQPGTYYFWKFKPGYVDDQEPDVEVFA